MPGLIFAADRQVVAGWAWHPRHPDYHVIIHVVFRSVILRSLLGDETFVSNDLPPEADGRGFEIDLTKLDVDIASLDELKLLIGETDEGIAPFDSALRRTADLSVDEIIGATFERPWVTGGTYFEAEEAGLGVYTIIDLFYRDYLGRQADPNGLTHYTARIKGGSLTYEELRRVLMQSDEYAMRRRHMYDAPGAIFSQGIVLAAHDRDWSLGVGGTSRGLGVSASDLMRLDREAFVTAVYRQILGKEPDEGGMAFYLYELDRGRTKLDIVTTLAAGVDAIMRGVMLVDVPAEPASPRAVERSSVRPNPEATLQHGWGFYRIDRPVLRERDGDWFVDGGRGSARIIYRRAEAETPLPATAPGLPKIVAVPEPTQSTEEPVHGRLVSIRQLIALDGDAFVTAAYEQILGKPADAAGLAHYAWELKAGRDKADIARQLATEDEAIRLGMHLIEDLDE